MAEKDNTYTEGAGYDLNPEGKGSQDASGDNVELNLADSEYQLARGMKSRHIQFLALGMLACSLFK